MGRAPCCDKMGLKKGPWTVQEDRILVDFVRKNGHGNWRALPKEAGLLRCGKSCRLRWINYLRPDIKRGKFSSEEEETIIKLHQLLGNRWSTIASRLPGRTDNEIKNVWNTHLKKRLLQREIDPATEAKATRSTSPMEGHSLISVGYRDVSVESSTSMKEDTLPDNSASVDDLATVCNLSDSFYDSHNVSSQIFSRISSIGSENNTVDSTSTLGWLQSNCVNYFDDPKFEDLLIDETFILGNQIFDNEERRLPRQSENATAMTSSKGMCEHISNLKAQYFTSACLEDDFLSCMDATDTNTNLLPLWNMELETNDDEASDDTHYWLNVLRQVGSSAVL